MQRCVQNCKGEEHRRDLCFMDNDIVSALYEDSKPYYKRNNKTQNITPSWNEFVAEYHAEACEAFKSWDIAGRSRQGPVLEYKKLTNASYKCHSLHL